MSKRQNESIIKFPRELFGNRMIGWQNLRVNYLTNAIFRTAVYDVAGAETFAASN